MGYREPILFHLQNKADGAHPGSVRLIILLLFKDGEDEELLIALGLLLIL